MEKKYRLFKKNEMKKLSKKMFIEQRTFKLQHMAIHLVSLHDSILDVFIEGGHVAWQHWPDVEAVAHTVAKQCTHSNTLAKKKKIIESEKLNQRKEVTD